MACLKYLEGLRGLAAFTVFNFHLLVLLGAEEWTWLLDLQLGQPVNWQVPIFFILSGRVLTASEPNSSKLASAFIRRTPRLVLPLIGVVVFNKMVSILSLGKFEWHEQKLVFGSIYELFAIPIDFTLFGGPISAIPGPAWTIPIEIQGSFVVYTMALILNHYSRKRYIILSIVLFVNVMFGSWNGHFIVGMILMTMEQDKIFESLAKVPHIRIIRLAVLLSVLVLCLVPNQSLPFTQIFQGQKIETLFNKWVVNAPVEYDRKIPSVRMLILTSSLMLFIETGSLTKRMLSSRILVYLGRISYMLYLVHYTFIYTAGMSVFRPMLGSDNIKMNPFPIFISSLVFVIPVADLLTRYLDRPSIQLSRKIDSWLKLGSDEARPLLQ
jgi:peptidoglycan/LPS O-acetylase OafA/YrhL